MRIVKPYGRSHVAGAMDVDDVPGRMLRQNDDLATSRDIVAFAHKHDPLIIAQWISTIDKIASKPKIAKGKRAKGPTAAQMHLRTVLGDGAWAYLLENKLLSGIGSAQERGKLRLIWQSKISPWGDVPLSKEDDKGRPSAKGRWYGRFVGEIAPEAVTPDHARRIVVEIHDHLYIAAKRKNPEQSARPDRLTRRRGMIAERARSIAGNVLKPGKHSPCLWTSKDCAKYAQFGDVARDIRQAAEREFNARSGSQHNRDTPGQRPAGKQILPYDLAAKILYDQYGKVFGTDTGIKEAQAAEPGLFALHSAIRECYRRFARDYRKTDILRILPCDMPSLFRLIGAQYRNRDINALIRLGKVIHYHGSDGQQSVITNWPSRADIKTSRFWGSDGQADIKRHEAFVRVWRHVIALASRTLHDWADPEGQKFTGEKDDILLNASKATEDDVFDSGLYRQKCQVLFGARAGAFCGDPDYEKSVLTLAIQGTAKLRHATFHFKGKDRFLQDMSGVSDQVPDNVMTEIAALWQADEAGRDQRLVDGLRGVCVEQFLSERQCRDIIECLSDQHARSGRVPLPRLRRVLTRHDNAHLKNARLPLPYCPNRTELEGNPWRLCQYSILKMLYDGPFRYWLEQRNSGQLNDYIDAAIERTTKAAQSLNGRGLTAEQKDLISARAEDLPRLADGERISDFLSRLSAATATEMRVQRGYVADAEAARKQAEFIGHLECDVIAPAFVDFLREQGFDFILAGKVEAPQDRAATYDASQIEVAPGKAQADTQPWQKVLYFIMHLVPVDDAGRLLHQIRKWQILETGDRSIADDLQAVLSLYLDMHDAKFAGGDALYDVEKFADFYENPDDFRIVFPLQIPTDTERSVPRRGLREILRFGHFPLLKRLAGELRITGEQVRNWQQARTADETGISPVAELQAKREELHEKAVKQTRDFDDANLQNYAHTLRGVVLHRHLAAHVTLSDLVRLHRVMMGVLGRLVDFAGLWERDFYFVMLALIHHRDLTPDVVFKSAGQKYLANGQIVEARRNILAAAPVAFMDDLNGTLPFDDTLAGARNDLMHFNMLRGDQSPDLTEFINLTRDLMKYDRKLKNAVSKSVREMLSREGMETDWRMDDRNGEHRLCDAVIQVRQARHFQGGKIKIRSKLQARGPKDRRGGVAITENLHSPYLVERIARLLGGRAKAQADITARTDFTDFCLERRGAQGAGKRHTRNGSSKSQKNRRPTR
ncbi:type VI-A CRISPR-associated RNA-guided ribonuclease Cas13a [Thalassospira xiamenensis]|uniref:type VI-A CRISPR-associated RNA-guided ribonuclease Cas13a n=1 Tax=Thalassospira xiamenensis TaxID=220697 RepID=UPI001FFE67D0|nr:type VI-A CRISPR-associated RNA-guided ribonuclease Cas13a [Thalassospira xiamenensis]MCK2169089.1 type VI-A CRISPR-associated RNA-guided ribonuclease Cas13a [Thalassospira xiamenensis]